MPGQLCDGLMRAKDPLTQDPGLLHGNRVSDQLGQPPETAQRVQQKLGMHGTDQVAQRLGA